MKDSINEFIALTDPVKRSRKVLSHFGKVLILIGLRGF
jgi:hypothetical protein